MLGKIYNSKGFQISLPYILLLLGTLLIVYSSYGTFESESSKELFKTIGNTILTGGVFAVLLKSMQYIGVFKEELSNLIYDPKALSNRIDLPEVWEKVSTVLFRNKFPKISDKVLKDVKDKYFPTTEASYYENAEHEIEIKIIDQSLKLVQITCKVNLDVICENKSTKAFYEFGYKKDGDYKLLNLKISGKDQTYQSPTSKTVNNTEFNIYNVKLVGSDKYKIEKTFTRDMNLSDDNLYLFRATKMFHKLKIQIHHESDLGVELLKMGTLANFNCKKEKPQFKEFLCEGLIYPEQGYIINLKIH